MILTTTISRITRYQFSDCKSNIYLRTKIVKQFVNNFSDMIKRSNIIIVLSDGKDQRFKL